MPVGQQPPRNEIYVVDGAVPDLQALLSMLTAMAPGRRVILLDPRSDGIWQLAAALYDESAIDALHLIAHGGAGNLRLGSATLDASSLERARVLPG